MVPLMLYLKNEVRQSHPRWKTFKRGMFLQKQMLHVGQLKKYDRLEPYTQHSDIVV